MPDGHFATSLRVACQRISRRIRYESTLDVAPHQYSVLIHLEPGPLTPGRLSDVERVSAPSMTRTVNGLVEAGLAVREPHPTDGRQVLVVLTDAGRELIARTRAHRDSWMTRRLDALTDAERALLVEALPVLTKLSEED